MAGGEFRLGTDSIYIADDGHIRPKGTSPKSWITWLHLERKTRHFRVFSATYGVRKKEARARVRATSETRGPLPSTSSIAIAPASGPSPTARESRITLSSETL